jgi:hypothetical protein
MFRRKMPKQPIIEGLFGEYAARYGDYFATPKWS